MQYTKEIQRSKEKRKARSSFAHSDSRKLLLICDGNGIIVFVCGDHSLVNLPLKHLMHRHLFSLGFTQHSLKKLMRGPHGRLLEPPARKRSFALELVRHQTGSDHELFKLFHMHKRNFLTKLEFKCSIARVQIGKGLMRQGPCKVVKKKLNLLDTQNDEHFVTLVEVTPSAAPLRSTFDDYFKTLNFLCARVERQKLEEGEEEESSMVKVKIEE